MTDSVDPCRGDDGGDGAVGMDVRSITLAGVATVVCSRLMFFAVDSWVSVGSFSRLIVLALDSCLTVARGMLFRGKQLGPRRSHNGNGEGASDLDFTYLEVIVRSGEVDFDW